MAARCRGPAILAPLHCSLGVCGVAGSLFEPKQTSDGGYGDADWPAVGFVDYAGGNYRLTRTSKYKGLGTDGKDLGADMDELVKAVSQPAQVQTR